MIASRVFLTYSSVFRPRSKPPLAAARSRRKSKTNASHKIVILSGRDWKRRRKHRAKNLLPRTACKSRVLAKVNPSPPLAELPLHRGAYAPLRKSKPKKAPTRRFFRRYLSLRVVSAISWGQTWSDQMGASPLPYIHNIFLTVMCKFYHFLQNRAWFLKLFVL